MTRSVGARAAVATLAAASTLAGAATSAAREGSGLCAPPSDRVLRGDLDGDRRLDRVGIAAAGSAADCRFFLVVRSSKHGLTRRRLAPPDADVRWPTQQVPAVERLARLGPMPKLVALVAVEAGASTISLAPYTMSGIHILRLEIEHPVGPRGTFIIGGSVATAFTVDCSSHPRRVVESLTSFGGGGRTVTLRRRLYVLRGEAFVLRSARSYRLPARALSRFPEFRSRRGPFGRCR